MGVSAELVAVFSVSLLSCARDYFAGSEWSVQSLDFVASHRPVSGIRLVWVIAQRIVSLGWLIVEIAVLRLIVWPHYLYGAVAMALLISGIVIVRATASQAVPT